MKNAQTENAQAESMQTENLQTENLQSEISRKIQDRRFLIKKEFTRYEKSHF